MDIENINPKLLKIIALAKGGVGGERTAAVNMVRAICEREGLDFDVVMSDKGEMPTEFEPDIKIRTKDELRVIIQVASKFATTPEYPNIRAGYYIGYREVWVKYTTTAAQHIDTLNAIAVYLKAYRREKKNFLRSLQTAFVAHHGLYPQFEQDEAEEQEPRQKTLEEKQDDWRAANMRMAMTESVNLRRELKG